MVRGQRDAVLEGSHELGTEPTAAVPASRPTWGNTWRFIAGAVLCLLIGWFAFVRSQPVPILSGVDLAFHEASHFLTSFLPRIIYFAGGSIGQIAWPLGIGIAFLLINRDLLGAGLCLAWSGTAAQNVSEYIADAPRMDLPLIGGLHDWNTILGPDHLDRLTSADDLARIVWVLGLALWLIGTGLCVAGPWIARRRAAVDASPDAAPQSDGWAVVPPWDNTDRQPTVDPSPDEPPVAPSPR